MSLFQAWDGIEVVADAGKALIQIPERKMVKKCFKEVGKIVFFAVCLKITSKPIRGIETF